MANKRWKHDPNPWKSLLLIPYDVAGKPDLHGFEGERWMNTKNTRGKTGEIRGQNKRDN